MPHAGLQSFSSTHSCEAFSSTGAHRLTSKKAVRLQACGWEHRVTRAVIRRGGYASVVVVRPASSGDAMTGLARPMLFWCRREPRTFCGTIHAVGSMLVLGTTSL